MWVNGMCAAVVCVCKTYFCEFPSACASAEVTVTVPNLSQASRGRPSPRALKPRLRYKLNHGVVGGVYYNLYTRGARPGRVG